MSWFKGKHWPILELGIFKWTCILFGVYVGVHFADFLKQYVWVVAVLTVIGAVRVLWFYSKDG